MHKLALIASAGLAATATANPGHDCSACPSCSGDAREPAGLADFVGPRRDTLIVRDGFCFYPVYDGPRMPAPEPAPGLAASRSVPAYSSNPGASVAIYLDFDGHLETSAAWADSYGVIDHPGMNFEGEPDSYTPAELTYIQQVWEQVSEDFSPFDVDVTTVEPAGLDGPGVALRVVFTANSDWLGQPAGGVAPYLGNFADPDGASVFTFVEGTGNGWAKGAAEATSHEAGHAFNLAHQSVYDNGVKIEEYNPGGDGWAPIMGVGYDQDLTTFHDGPNSFGPLSFQDDLFVMRSTPILLDYRADDHSGSPGSPVPLSPAPNGQFETTGIVEKSNDADVFGFDHAGGFVLLNVEGNSIYQNLNARLRLIGNGQNIDINPDDSLNARFQGSLPAGSYRAIVSSNGEYGRLGQYRFSGRFTPVVPDCADLDGSGTVDLPDLLQLLAAFGTASPDEDLDGSGTVDLPDLLELLSLFGGPC